MDRSIDKETAPGQPEPDRSMPAGIEAITRYEVGGRTFSQLDDAIEFKEQYDDYVALDQMLPSAVDDERGSFERGDGYIQHHDAALELFTERFAELLEKYHGHELAAKFRDDPKSQHVGRVLDDSGSIFDRAAYRLSCIDSANREWGTPYIALNPEEGTQREWPNKA